MKPKLPEGWIDADEQVPDCASVVCVLRPGHWVGFFQRDLAQYTTGFGWGHVGSDQRMRDVIAWCPLPKLPERQK